VASVRIGEQDIDGAADFFGLIRNLYFDNATSGLAGIPALAFVLRELDPQTLLRIGNPLQGGHRNVK
jgi:hypothetical protein